MGVEQKGFAGGGMDFDSSKNYIASNDYGAAYNIRLTGNSDNEELEVSNIESNEIIEGTRATGINKAIGACGFERTGYGYSWIFNSAGYHQLIEIDNEAETETVIFTNITDSGGVNILPLDPQWYVNDIKLLHGKYLIFTDSNMEPGYLNLERLKAGTLGVLTADDFKLIKAQPLILPTARYNDDTGRSTNLLRGNLFQFAYYYTFLDYEDSALSSYSKMVVPENETTPATGTDVTKDNNIIVTIDATNDRVKTLNIAARIGGQSAWFLIKSIDRADLVAITDTVVDVSQQVYEAYDPATGLYSFAFYNDENYPNLDELFTDLDYDHVPKKAGALEVINGSILALADLTEGEERPVIDATVSVVAFDPAIAVAQPDPTISLKVSSATNKFLSRNGKPRRITVTYSGTAKTGDIFTIQIRDARNNSLTIDYTDTVRSIDNNNTAAAVQHLSTKVPNSSVSGTTITFITIDHHELSHAKVDLLNAGSGVSRSISSLKTNSSYQLALTHYDKYGRYFPIATNSKLIAKTPSYAQTFGQIPKILWTINNTPPTGAVSAQWLLTKNNTHETTVYTTAVLDATASDANYLVFRADPLLEFNEKNASSILNYEYSAGDRCTFLKMIDGATVTWFNSPPVDVEVVGFEIEVDETVPSAPVTHYVLRVRKSAAITEADITAKNILLEVYSPKKRVSVVDGENTLNPTLFYEIGERISITNGAYDTTSGEITQGDCYFKTRDLADGTDLESIASYLVEDFNFSDFYQSNYTSYGRARFYNDMKGEIRRKACIRYSDVALEGSEINGITRFYGERLYGDAPGQTSSNYGAISKIVQVDNRLICIQELKPGFIPVNITIIEDQVAEENIAISDKLLNNIRYTDTGSYGIGGAKESFAQRPDGTLYYVDPFNSLPIRIGNDGTRPIAGKMSKFFKRTLQAAYKAGLKIVGYYDKFHDEYVVAIHQIGDVVTTFPFNEMNWRYLEEYTVLRDDITITTPPTKGTVTYNPATGKDVYVSYPGASGADSFVYTFLVDGVVTTKRVCISITPGDGTPDQFYFLDIEDAELSTVYTSNSILVNNINMPTPISISAGGEFRINGTGTWYTSSSTGITVVNEDTVEVRQTSSGSFETATDVTLTIGGISDTYTVTTREAVPVVVNYSLTKDSNPHVDLLIVPVVNGTNLGNIYPTSTGTFAGILEGDSVYMGIAHSVTGIPWPADSKATLVITADGVPIYTSGDKTDPLVVDLANYTFIAEAGVVYDVIAVSDSTSGYYSPVSFSMNNASSAPLSVSTEVVSFEFIDNTDSLFVLHTGQYTQPQNNVGFNWLTDANTGKLVIDNNSAYSLDFELSNIAEGGSYTSTITVASLASGEFNTLPKTGYSITYTDTIAP